VQENRSLSGNISAMSTSEYYFIRDSNLQLLTVFTR